MSFQPVIPFGGNAGWAFLARTRATQEAAFSQAPVHQRETAYFAENIGAVETADQLIEDRTLLKVALGAFGLDADIDNKYFLKRILEDGTLTSDALSNKLADKRYRDFSKAFGFGDFSVPRTVLSTFATEITSTYSTLQFETAVGNQNESLRLAMTLERQLPEIASSSNTNDGKWFTIMGTAPLRAVFETALGLPKSIGSLDIDKQLEIFKDRAQRSFGTSELADFGAPELLEDVNRNYLARSEISSGSQAASSGSLALSLLQNSGISYGRLF